MKPPAFPDCPVPPPDPPEAFDPPPPEALMMVVPDVVSAIRENFPFAPVVPD